MSSLNTVKEFCKCRTIKENVQELGYEMMCQMLFLLLGLWSIYSPLLGMDSAGATRLQQIQDQLAIELEF